MDWKTLSRLHTLSIWDVTTLHRKYWVVIMNEIWREDNDKEKETL